jgi:SAM-dependent methyltransferase
MGPSALWLAEWVCRDMDLQPGMRVLDMGCGRSMSSIFMSREYGVKVWANDLWISASENWELVKEAGMEDLICPIHAEAHALPYAEGFFDAAVCLDSYNFGTTISTHYSAVSSARRTARPRLPGLTWDFETASPSTLPPSGADCWSIRTSAWVKKHWRHRTGGYMKADMIVEVALLAANGRGSHAERQRFLRRGT